MESNNKERINEKLIINSEINIIDKYLIKVCKSVCKIRISNRIGSGFLIKLYRKKHPFYCLMTNEHVITKKMVELKEKIDIYYDNQYKFVEIELNENKRYIKDYLYLDIDVIIIEIIKEDNIKEEYFLLPNIEYINGYKEYEN